jgi:hypothetical protein
MKDTTMTSSIDSPQIRESAERFAERFAATYPGCPPEGLLWQENVGLFLTARGVDYRDERDTIPAGHDETFEWNRIAVETAKSLLESYKRSEELQTMLHLARRVGADISLVRCTDEQAVCLREWAEANGAHAENLEHHFTDGQEPLNVLRVSLGTWHATAHLKPAPTWSEFLRAALGEPKINEVGS